MSHTLAEPPPTTSRSPAGAEAYAFDVPRQLAAPPPPAWRRKAPKLRPRRLLIGALAAAVAVAVYWYAWADAWSLVRYGGANSHVLLAPFAVAWLAYVRRNRLPHIRVTGRWVGLVLFCCGAGLLHSGEAVGLESLFHFGALLTAVGAAVAVCGKGLLLRFIPVAGALLFLIPVPGRVREYLQDPLRDATADLVVRTINFVGPPAYADAGRIMVSTTTTTTTTTGGDDAVAAWRAIPIEKTGDAMPMAMGLVLVTYAFAFAYPMRNRYRWLLLALSPAVILLYGTLRATPIVLGYAYAADDPDGAARQVADFMAATGSWLILPLAFLLLQGVVGLLRWCDLRVDRYRLAG